MFKLQNLWIWYPSGVCEMGQCQKLVLCCLSQLVLFLLFRQNHADDTWMSIQNWALKHSQKWLRGARQEIEEKLYMLGLLAFFLISWVKARYLLAVTARWGRCAGAAVTMCVVLWVKLSGADVAVQWERLWAELFSASASVPRTGQAVPLGWLYLTEMESGLETAGKIFNCGKYSGIFNCHMDGKRVWYVDSLLAHLPKILWDWKKFDRIWNWWHETWKIRYFF